MHNNYYNTGLDADKLTQMYEFGIFVVQPELRHVIAADMIKKNI